MIVKAAIIALMLTPYLIVAGVAIKQTSSATSQRRRSK